MRSLPSIVFFAASFATGLAAQASIVYPSSHQNIPNGASQIGNVPFSGGITRTQIVYEDWDLELAVNTPITRIGLRQDGAQAAVSRLIQLEVRIGTTFATASTLSTTFDSNFSGQPTTVFPLGVFTLPALTSATTGAPIWVNLATPWVYPGGNLLVEFRVYGNNNGNQGFYYPLDVATFVSTVTSGPQGCPHSGNTIPTLTSSGTQIGSNWNLTLSQAPAGTAVALFLAPGQSLVSPYSLSFLGLQPTCTGQLPATALLSLSASTDTNGYKLWTVPVPYNLAFNNFIISSQAVAFDFFSPGNLVTSNGDQVQFGVTPAESFVYSQGSASATTGSVYANYGIVTLFN